ncbi:hypothetical protein [Streptomyces wedmorensis]
MRSEMQSRVPERRQAHPNDRFGAVVAACAAVLFTEAVIGLIAAYVWGQTQEGPSTPINPMALLLLVVAAPFLVAAVYVFSSLLTVSAVSPLLRAAAWLGRRFSGRETWWWVPVATAAATAPPVLAGAILTDTGPLTGLAGWLAATATLTAPALVARRLLLPNRPRLSGRAMFWRVAAFGTLASVGAFALAGIALSAGIGYEPPLLNAEQAAGTYSDGRGGTLTLTADGRATVSRLHTFDFSSPGEPLVRECSGIGAWSRGPADGPYVQQVDVSVDACPVDIDGFDVHGTREAPKLYATVGDPDAGEFYVLRRD